MDLIASKFGLLALASHHYGPARGVHFHGMAERDFGRQTKDLSQHFNHVIIGMLVIVEKHHVEKRSEVFSLLLSRTLSR